MMILEIADPKGIVVDVIKLLLLKNVMTTKRNAS